MSEPFEPEGSGAADEADGLWSELTDDLLGLTDKLRTTYRQAAEEAGPTEDEVRDALRTLSGAWNQLAGSVGEAIQDPEVKTHLKKAATSLVNAVGTSLAEFFPTREPVATDKPGPDDMEMPD